MSRLFVWDSLVHYGTSWFNLEKTWKNSGKLLANYWQKLIVTNFQNIIDKCIHMLIIKIKKGKKGDDKDEKLKTHSNQQGS